MPRPISSNPARTTLPMGSDRPDPRAEQPWYLAAMHDGELLDLFVLSASHTTLGREPTSDNGIALPDAAVSRVHAAVAWFPGEPALWVQDLESSNGTFLNGQRITGATACPGDVLRVGDSLLVVGRGAPSPAADAAGLGLVGRSSAMSGLREMLRKVAPSALPALVLGQTGTGKELVARAIHDESGRRGRFVAVNCAALPGNLVESVLFGHKKGAFTGASSDVDGAFVQADGGTLFLDEIGDLAPEAQPKLLRALENGEITPVGAVRPLSTRVRLVAATHVALDEAITSDSFRRDLFARLAGVIVRTPSLVERREDVLDLFRSFLGPEATRQLSADFTESLLLHRWPFNVRELRKLAERLEVLNPGVSRWERRMLDDALQAFGSATPPPPAPQRAEAEQAEEEAERAGDDRRPPPSRDELLELLDRCGGNVSRVAELAGRNRKQVYRWMEIHGIERGAGRKA